MMVSEQYKLLIENQKQQLLNQQDNLLITSKENNLKSEKIIEYEDQLQKLLTQAIAQASFPTENNATLNPNCEFADKIGYLSDLMEKQLPVAREQKDLQVKIKALESELNLLSAKAGRADQLE